MSKNGVKLCATAKVQICLNAAFLNHHFPTMLQQALLAVRDLFVFCFILGFSFISVRTWHQKPYSRIRILGIRGHRGLSCELGSIY